MVEYLSYCRGLHFEARPDYSYLRRLLRNLFKKNHFTHDIVFDWNLLKISGNDAGANAASVATGNGNVCPPAHEGGGQLKVTPGNGHHHSNQEEDKPGLFSLLVKDSGRLCAVRLLF